MGAHMSATLELAISAIRAGRKDEGRQLLNLLIQQNPNDEKAWLWMSSVVNTDEQRARCLYHVLAIKPDNALARRGLELLGIVVSDSRPVKVPRESKPIPISRPSPKQRSETQPMLTDRKTITDELPFTPVNPPFEEELRRPKVLQLGPGATPSVNEAVQPPVETPAEPQPPDTPPDNVPPPAPATNGTPPAEEQPAAPQQPPPQPEAQPTNGQVPGFSQHFIAGAGPLQATRPTPPVQGPPNGQHPNMESYAPQHSSQTMPQYVQPPTGQPMVSDPTQGMPQQPPPQQPPQQQPMPQYPQQNGMHSNMTMAYPQQPYQQPQQQQQQQQPPGYHSNQTMNMPSPPVPQPVPHGQPQTNPYWGQQPYQQHPGYHSNQTMNMPSPPMPQQQPYQPRPKRKRDEDDEGEEVNLLAIIIFGSLSVTALGGLGMLILLMFTTTL